MGFRWVSRARDVGRATTVLTGCKAPQTSKRMYITAFLCWTNRDYAHCFVLRECEPKCFDWLVVHMHLNSFCVLCRVRVNKQEIENKNIQQRNWLSFVTSSPYFSIMVQIAASYWFFVTELLRGHKRVETDLFQWQITTYAVDTDSCLSGAIQSMKHLRVIEAAQSSVPQTESRSWRTWTMKPSNGSILVILAYN